MSFLLFDAIPFFLQDPEDQKYKIQVDMMSMDIRARPSERTKTPEEIAQNEREKLEALEVCFC